jgi:hypothetical protein
MLFSDLVIGRATKFAREVRWTTLVLTASMNSFWKLPFASAVATMIRLRTVDLNFGYKF